MLALCVASPVAAQYNAIPNYTGVGAGQQFHNAINNALSGATPIAPRLVTLSLTNLLMTPENDGQIYWCKNCAQAPVCGTTGQGAVAIGAGGQWTCVLGPIQPGSPPVGIAGGDLSSAYPNPTVSTVLNGQMPVTTAQGINVLSPAGGSYSMNTHRLSGLAADSTTGDALSRGQSSLSALTPPTAAFGMNGQTLQSVGAAGASGQPLVGGMTNPVANTEVSVNGTLNVMAQFGAKGDTRSGTDGVTNHTATFTSASANFTSADVGKAIAINGTSGVPAGTTIASVVNATTVFMSAAATGSATALSWWVGTNDGAAILAAAQASCPSAYGGNYFCTAPVYFPPGTYYVRNLVLNPSTIGGGTAVSGLHLICAGSNGRGLGSSPAMTTILVDDNAGSVGIDMFANANAVIENCDIRTLTTSTGPKALLAYGKTQSCDCDVLTFRNDSFETYSTDNIGTIFSLGGEDTDIENSMVSAFNGGHTVVLSATNAVGGGVSASGETLDQPATTNPISTSFPVSMQHSNVRSSVLLTNGGSSPSAAPAAAFYLDVPNSGAWANGDGIENTDIQLTGYNDIGLWDGQQGSAGGTVASLGVRHVVVECLSNAGNGHCQALKLGNNTARADISLQHNAAQQLSRTANDGVTNGTTTFTSASAAFTFADAGSLITVAGASGIPQGTYIASVTNSTTVVLSVAAVGSATGLTWVVSVPVIQFYNNFTISSLGMSVYLGSGPSMSCKSGGGSQVALSGSLAQASCPGSTIYADSNAAQNVQQLGNSGVGVVLRAFQDYGTRGGYDLQCTNAAWTQTLCDIDANGNANFNSWEAVKLAGAPGSAIGANYCQMFVVAGTTGGTCKIQAICGTSTTPVTIVDNVGSGC